MPTASDLFARAHQCINQGTFECHYCGAACSSAFIHEDQPVLSAFRRNKEFAKRPGNQFICAGCWQWRRKSMTVCFLSGGFKDRQTPRNYSWLITEKGAWGIRLPEDFPALYQFLRAPTCSFSLMIVCSGQQNLIQKGVANDMSVVNGDTPIQFTLNGVPYQYSVYEFEHALQNGYEPTEPGVRMLLDLWRPPAEENEQPVKRGRGRPRKEEEVDGRDVCKPIRKSGHFGD